MTNWQISWQLKRFKGNSTEIVNLVHPGLFFLSDKLTEIPGGSVFLSNARHRIMLKAYLSYFYP